MSPYRASQKPEKDSGPKIYKKPIINRIGGLICSIVGHHYTSHYFGAVRFIEHFYSLSGGARLGESKRSVVDICGRCLHERPRESEPADVVTVNSVKKKCEVCKQMLSYHNGASYHA